MKVAIALTAHQPPVGTVAVDGGQPIEFSGWLGLMSLLGGVVDAAGDADDVRGSSLRSAPDSRPDDTQHADLARGRSRRFRSREG